ncbi:aldehyde dehydrogenase [Bradyrhizobium sp. LTSP885]|nr:aldehyde dehydrogenase [Bradyrhizobium sp. LTSP885]
MPSGKILIGGRWHDGERVFPVMDKYTGEAFAEVQQASRQQVAAAVEVATEAAEKGPLPPVERAVVLRRAAEQVRLAKERFVELMIREAGFTTVDARGEVDRAQVTLNLCAEEATRIVGEAVSFASSPGQHERLGFTVRVPIGVVCAITPFNSPLNTVLHKLGPAFAAGNAVILKPSALTPLTAALLCEILLEAGMPPSFLSLIQGEGNGPGAWLLEEQAIGFYTFTGSTRVGRAIQAAAGLRRTQLELGSIASTIVCADADLDRALPKIANAAFRKAGQVCTSIQRLYVESTVLDEVTERLGSAANAMKAGNPQDPTTVVGPMISESSAERAESWVNEARLAQARIVAGGTRSYAVMKPTVITGALPGMKILDQEIFAPVVSILPFTDLGKAVSEANSTPYGLSAGIFAGDVSRAVSAAKKLRFGSVHINETSSARADAMPFGGVKDSGFGHEGPRYAIRELTEERLVTLNP